METYADIQLTLSTLGEVLTFPTFTIYGILETVKTDEDMLPSFSQVVTQQHTFHISTKDSVVHSITTDNTFTWTDNVLTYTFTVSKPPVPDLYGLSKLSVNLTNKVAV